MLHAFKTAPFGDGESMTAASSKRTILSEMHACVCKSPPTREKAKKNKRDRRSKKQRFSIPAQGKRRAEKEKSESNPSHCRGESAKWFSGAALLPSNVHARLDDRPAASEKKNFGHSADHLIFFVWAEFCGFWGGDYGGEEVYRRCDAEVFFFPFFLSFFFTLFSLGRISWVSIHFSLRLYAGNLLGEVFLSLKNTAPKGQNPTPSATMAE